MKCPIYSFEMRAGFIQGGRSIICSTYKLRISFLLDSPKGGLQVSEENLVGAYAESWHCPVCHMVLIEKV